MDVAEHLGVEVRNYDAEAIPHAIVAREKYSAGRHGLNLGDCLSYGAARQRRARMLYLGEIFARTDVNDHV